MIISIASGKGGTGKTALALLLASNHPDITLVDCDVEEPNCHLFLKPQQKKEPTTVNVTMPLIDSVNCNGCGSCASVCLFNALAITAKKAMLFDELCHNCGGCIIACPVNAISETQKMIGHIELGQSSVLPAVNLLSGTLNIGTPSAVPLIRSLRETASALTGTVLLDCPPGTACSMVTAIKSSDYCILVTEPNLFGKHDLTLAMNITSLLGIPTGVVINKSDEGVGDELIEKLCQERQIPILAKLPHSLEFAKKYAAGKISAEFQNTALKIWQKLRHEFEVIK